MNLPPFLVRITAFAVPVVVICCGPGCNQGPNFTTVPVSGKITVDGTPLPAGQVTYTFVGEGVGVPSGGAIKDGEYMIYTGGKAGAPVGKYKVTVTPVMMPSADGKMPKTNFNSKFSEPSKTTLTVDVTATPPPNAYDLKLTK
ncbi:hypothetical protein [Fimbriiglobus ruber]|uniref:Carboxypeptidase regulatory-like domain-containing protein n=1 Tax=Fimbriiglobus ruber TaxID=1908690 RepID=A0A225CZD1_9BACT|nr:hypothetical protein [Fimbriiglobus ruber]OWK34720.1 hypothetical protein FRUB_09562 [Fimbriiglobus ruber]